MASQFHQAVLVAGGAMLAAIEEARQEFECDGNVIPQSRLAYTEALRSVETLFVKRVIAAARKYGDENIAAEYRDRLRGLTRPTTH